ncbi:MAG: TonB-dependent receptor, partial [Caulobacterales bacterium]
MKSFAANSREVLLATSALLFFCGAPSASAQADNSDNETSAASSGGLEEVVVTARRREENQQTTPVAVTTFSASEIQARSMTNIADIANVTPSLSASTSSYSNFGINVRIRGQAAIDSVISLTPPIGVYVDDVYLSTTQGLGAGGLADVSNVEVLKGPQGTLYGRNSTGGALKLTTLMPDYDGVSGTLRTGLYSYDGRMVFGTVNTPIVEDRLAFRVSATYDKNDGYGTQINAGGAPVGDREAWGIRATLLADPTDNLRLILRANYADASTGGDAARQVYSANPAIQPYVTNAFTYDTPNGRERSGFHNSNGVSLTAIYDVTPNFSITSISASHREHDAGVADLDNSPVITVEGGSLNTRYQQITQEIKFSGDTLDSRLNWQAGFFYYDLSALDTATVNQFQPVPTVFNSATYTDTSKSVFVQGTYDILSNLHFTTGIRYTSETNRLEARDRSGVGGVNCVVPVSQRIGDQCLGVYGGRFHDTSYLLSLDWNVTDDVLLYLKNSTGFKAGGVNQRSSAAGYLSFGPENVEDTEFGVKSEWFDNRLRANAAIFHTGYDNIQRSDLVTLPTGTVATLVSNAGAASIDGAELELTALPIENLTVSFGGSYTYPKYKWFFNGAGRDIASLEEYQGVPRYQANLAISYEQPVAFGSITPRLDVSYTSPVTYSGRLRWSENGGTTVGGNGRLLGYAQQDEFMLVNARVDFEFDAQDLKLSVYGRNILDEEYITGASDYTAFSGIQH